MLTEPKIVLPLAIVSTTDITRFNALRRGARSRYTVLPWEDQQAYRAIAIQLLGCSQLLVWYS